MYQPSYTRTIQKLTTHQNISVKNTLALKVRLRGLISNWTQPIAWRKKLFFSIREALPGNTWDKSTKVPSNCVWVLIDTAILWETQNSPFSVQFEGPTSNTGYQMASLGRCPRTVDTANRRSGSNGGEFHWSRVGLVFVWGLLLTGIPGLHVGVAPTEAEMVFHERNHQDQIVFNPPRKEFKLTDTQAAMVSWLIFSSFPRDISWCIERCDLA